MLARVDRYVATLRPRCAFLNEYAELHIDALSEPWEPRVTMEHPTADDLRTCREAIELLVVIGSVDMAGLYALLQRSSGGTFSRTPPTVGPATPPPRWYLDFPCYDAGHPLLDTDAFRSFCIRDRTEPRSAAFCRAMAQIYASMTPAMRAALTEMCEIVCPITMGFQPTSRDLPQTQHREYIAAAHALLDELAAETEHRHGVDRTCSHAKICSAEALVGCVRFDVVSAILDLEYATFALEADAAADIGELAALGVDTFRAFRFHPDCLIENTPLVHLGRIFHDHVNAKDAHGLALCEPATTMTQRRRYGSQRQTQLVVHADDVDSDEPLLFRGSSPRRFFALCSALVSTQRIRGVHVNNLFAYDTADKRRKKCQWLSYAVLSKAAASCVESLVLQDSVLRASDVEAIMSVLERAYPVPKLMDRASLVSFFNRDGGQREQRDPYRYTLYEDYNVDIDRSDYDESDYDESNDDESDDEDGPDYYLDIDSRAVTATPALPAAPADRVTTDTSDETQAANAERAALPPPASADEATARAPNVNLTAMFARTSAAKQFHMRPAAADGAANADDDESPIVDEDAGSVLLKTGTVVVVNPCDPKDWVDRAQQTITVEHDVQFPILHNDTRCEWIDIIVPGFGYCAVPRAFVDRIVLEPVDDADSDATKSSLAVGYTGAITSLSLQFETCEERPDLLLPLFQYLGPQLTSLALNVQVGLESGDFRRILDACPRLRELEMRAVPPGVLAALVDVYAAGTCHVEKLKVSSCSSGVDTLALIDSLQNPSSAIAQTLRYLSLKCDGSSSLSEQALAALALMLQANNVLETVEIHASSIVPRNVWLDLIATDGKHLPAVAAPLPLASRLAFLSVLQHHERQQQQPTTPDVQDAQDVQDGASVQPPPLKRMRVCSDDGVAMPTSTNGADLARLDTSLIRLIFAFAAEPATRKVRIWKHKCASRQWYE